LITPIGRAVAVTAAILSIMAWSVLAFGFAYSWLFVPKERKDPKAVMSPRVSTQVFTIAAVACIFAAGFMAAVTALLSGESTYWAWIGVGANAAFLVPFGGALALARYRDLARKK
jgi:hypothetical protein